MFSMSQSTLSPPCDISVISSKKTFLWVDALCINQMDDNEKTHQVNQMGSIYQNSKSVLVYLGDGIGVYDHKQRSKAKSHNPPPVATFFENAENIENFPFTFTSSQGKFLKRSLEEELEPTDTAMSATLEVFSLIKMLSTMGHLDELPCFHFSKEKDTQTRIQNLFEFLRQFTHAPFTPWWSRIWVVQEVILPPAVTLVYGTISAPWTLFTRAALQLLDHSHQCFSATLKKIPRDHLIVLQGFCRLVLGIADMRKSYSSLDANPLTSSKLSLLSLLRRFRNRKASDPRDKVYALLGLVSNIYESSSMQPDYSLSDREVFKRAALTSIYDSASLSVLNVDVSRKFRQDLPSWVPDWEAPGDFSGDSRVETIDLYNSSTRYPVDKTTITSSGDMLFIDISYIGSVQKIGSAMLSEDCDAVRATLAQWMEILALSLQSEDFSLVQFQSYHSIWSILCADVITFPNTSGTRRRIRRANPEDELLFTTWACLSPSSPFNENIPLQNIISRRSILWQKILMFEISITQKNLEQTVAKFEEIFPEQEARATVIADACAISHTGGTGHTRSRVDEKPFKFEELIQYSTWSTRGLQDSEWMTYLASRSSTQHTILEESEEFQERLRNSLHKEAPRKQLQAWRQIPWLLICERMRTKFLDNLWSASETRCIPVTNQVAIMEHSIISATKSRRLFIASKNRVELGPASMARGDALCFLQGGRTPFILRKGDDALFEEHKSSLPPSSEAIKDPPLLLRRYELIGDCYVDGLMDYSGSP